HLALFHLDRQHYGPVLRLYDERVYPQANEACVVLVDATSLLWRLNLEGAAIGARPAVIADVWRRRMAEGLGHYAFNEVHAAMAYCLDGSIGDARELVRHLEGIVGEMRGSNAAMTRDVGIPLAGAIVAFAEGDYPTVIEKALPVRDRANVFGGSHAQ